MSVLLVDDTLKALRETFCLAQTYIGNSARRDKMAHVERLQRLIDDVDLQRPLDADGRHGDRHTPTCGCEVGRP